MKNKHIFWGVFFISIGIFILINNVSSYDFYYDEVGKVWPFVLVLLGVALLIKQPLVRSIFIGLTAFTLAFALYSSIRTGFTFFDEGGYYSDDETEVSWNGDYKVNKYSEPYSSAVTDAILNFDAGAGTFFIQDSTANLFDVKTEGSGNSYTLDRFDGGNTATIDFMMKKKKFTFHEKFKNKVVMKLNPNPVWEVNMHVGAATLNLDLSKYKVRDFHVEMGAAKFRALLGVPADETNVKVEAGVSDIDVIIPPNVGCEIRTDVALSSKHFDGFRETEDNVYRSEDFNKSTKKIFIEFNTGVSSISVKRGTSW